MRADVWVCGEGDRVWWDADVGARVPGVLLAALGLKLAVIEDPEALERVRDRLTRRSLQGGAGRGGLSAATSALNVGASEPKAGQVETVQLEIRDIGFGRMDDEAQEEIEGAVGKFMLQQMVSIAELEAGLISARTKAALAEAKKRGVVLGGYHGRDFTAKDIKASVATRQAQAAQRAADVMPVVTELQAAGATSLRAIAAGLKERGIPAARGGKWSAVQVMRLLESGRPFDSASVAAA